MIYNVVLVSGVQQSDSVIYIHISILFHILLINFNGSDSFKKLFQINTITVLLFRALYVEGVALYVEGVPMALDWNIRC